MAEEVRGEVAAGPGVSVGDEGGDDGDEIGVRGGVALIARVGA
ncbi:hypothetical protein [Streptomyces atratus]